MADTQSRRGIGKGFTAAESFIALVTDLLGTISATSMLIVLSNPTKELGKQGNPCRRLTVCLQNTQSMDLSSNGKYGSFDAWKGEIHLVVGLIIDLRQAVSVFYKHTNKHRTAVFEEPTKEFNPDLSLQISRESKTQKGHLSTHGTGSSRLQDIISMGVFAGLNHRSGSRILTTEDSHLPRSIIEPPDQALI